MALICVSTTYSISFSSFTLTLPNTIDERLHTTKSPAFVFSITILSPFLSKTSSLIGSSFNPLLIPSVNTPYMAETAAVSGLTRYTSASIVPLLPLKFLLKVLKEIPPDFGDCPMPMQGPHAHSMILAPAFIIWANAPFSASLDKILLDPGEITRLTLS